jgi:hypothetical protein
MRDLLAAVLVAVAVMGATPVAGASTDSTAELGRVIGEGILRLERLHDVLFQTERARTQPDSFVTNSCGADQCIILPVNPDSLRGPVYLRDVMVTQDST